MNIKHIVGLLVLVAVIFFGTVFMFVYKTFAPSPTENSSQNQNSQTQTNTTQNSNATTTVVVTPPPTENIPLPFSDEESLTPGVYTNECTLQKKAAAQGQDYKKGSVLVTFYDTMDFDIAVKTVELLSPQLGLEVEDSFEARKNFRQNHWLEVIVPQYSEFYTQCELEGKEGVKRTSLNFLFSLRQ